LSANENLALQGFVVRRAVPEDVAAEHVEIGFHGALQVRALVVGQAGAGESRTLERTAHDEFAFQALHLIGQALVQQGEDDADAANDGRVGAANRVAADGEVVRGTVAYRALLVSTGGCGETR